jgi:hypothetical protein
MLDDKRLGARGAVVTATSTFDKLRTSVHSSVTGSSKTVLVSCSPTGAGLANRPRVAPSILFHAQLLSMSEYISPVDLHRISTHLISLDDNSVLSPLYRDQPQRRFAGVLRGRQGVP